MQRRRLTARQIASSWEGHNSRALRKKVEMPFAAPHPILLIL